MIVCPVCEHAQASGTECDLCGRRLVFGPAGIPYVAPVEGLESTCLAPVDAPETTMPDLERTRADPVDVVEETVPGVEPTRAAPVDAEGEEVPGVEHTAVEGIPDDGPTALPADVTCRYCRTPAQPGDRVCGRCGMRLPVYEPVLDILFDDGAPGPQLCSSCGVPATGVVCPTCGARLVPPDRVL
ncbi:MAG TPA: hypothetical protein VLS93_02385 [Anaeromyxobacteraceae bacterium]|nr:hypothetical protein [Anaeromyxobacteraceae bacterium]